MPRRIRIALLAAALTALASIPARAVPVNTITAAYFDYYPGSDRTPELQLHIQRGSMLVLVNADTLGGPHSVTDAIGTPPAFGSDPIDPPNVAEVHGVETLIPGVYRFTCVVHPNLMSGTLYVDA